MYARAGDSGFDADSSIMSDRSFTVARPLSGNAFLAKTASQPSSTHSSPSKGHRRTDSTTNIPTLSPTKAAPSALSPSKVHASPGKSSLSSISRFAEANTFDHEAAVWSDEEGARTPRGTLRHPKSVSFDVGPPQINEYEQITPDPSSVASGSREGSYEDDDEDDDIDLSFERGYSEEHEDSFDHSLEDTEKTPVVLPEDWRFMSPEAANTDLADTFDDPFDTMQDSMHAPESRRGSLGRERTMSRSLSIASDGEPRPLPPLPMSNSPSEGINAHSASGSRSHTPNAPRPASISKDDVLGMQNTSLPLEERLRRLSVQNESRVTTEVREVDADSTDEATMTLDTAGGAQPELLEKWDEPGHSLKRMKSQDFRQSDIEKYANLDPDVPIPSREASSNYEDEEGSIAKSEFDATKDVVDMYALPEAGFNSQHSSPFDDDLGRESSVIHHDIPIYEDEDDDHCTAHNSQVEMPDTISDGLEHPAVNDENQAPANELHIPKQAEHEQGGRNISLPEFSEFSAQDSFGYGLESYMTPSPPATVSIAAADQSIADTHDPQKAAVDEEPLTQVAPAPSFEPEVREEMGTPESIIRRSSVEEPSSSQEQDASVVPATMATVKASNSKLKTRASTTTAELEALRNEEIHMSSEAPPAIPAGFTDLVDSSVDNNEGINGMEALSADQSRPNRRQSMRMTLDMPLGTGSDDLGFGMDKEFDRLLEAQKVDISPLPAIPRLSPNQQDTRSAEFMAGQGFSHQDTEADLHARRKRGYLMRQNTKVVVATNRSFSNEKPYATDAPATAAAPAKTSAAHKRETKSAGNSPRKPSVPTVMTEPWNGKMRRHSTRKSIISGEKPLSGARKSIGGQDSNMLDALTEDQQSILEPEAGAERGRFFVKVIGVKNLDLPLPRSKTTRSRERDLDTNIFLDERTYFQLTLDNGLHCVTTAWLELGRTAQIGQEFELTVFDDLDFSLTLQTKLERPTSQASDVSAASSLESPRKKEKQSTFSRLLTTPKKRREAERKQQEEQAELARQRQREIEAQRANVRPTAWDLLHNLVGPDGSFAQSIVSLDDYEEKAFGRPLTTDVPCYNNWAVADSFNSTKSKHGGIQRKPPYKIGNLTLQLLYIPKPKGVGDEEMPQSMSACVKQLKEAEANVTRQFEGPLSQQGGDCPYWRRRFFKLNGSILTAYHEATRQRRANIRLAKATKLIDDRSALTKDEASAKGGKGRRRSAFASDTEGYMFVEEGFRICFANGDTIDFYADTREQKEEWMDHLSNVIGKDFSADKPTWMAAVLACEKSKAVTSATQPSQSPKRPAPQPAPSQQNPLRSNPASPTKQASPAKKASPTKKPSPMEARRTAVYGNAPPPPIDKSPRHSLQASPQKSKTTGKPTEEPAPRQSGSANSSRRKAVRSMIF